jgi:hypothetical protein
MENAGVDSVLLILRNSEGVNSLPAALVSDLAAGLWEKSEYAAVLEVLGRCSEVVPEHQLRQVRCLALLGRDGEAQALAATLDPSVARRDTLVFALSLKALVKNSGDRLPATSLEDLRKQVTRMSPAAALVAAELAIRHEQAEDTKLYLSRAIQASNYDAYSFQRISDRLRVLPQERSVQRDLDDAVSLLDPRNTRRNKLSKVFFGE